MFRLRARFFTLFAAAIAAVVLSSAASADCSRWVVGPGQQAAGPLGSVYAIQHWDPDGTGPMASKMVVGGSFLVAGTSLVNHIAAWNGASWEPLGDGFDGPVRALTVYNNQLVAAGSFTRSGATVCNRIARWNGTVWQPLGAGTDGDIRAMAIHSGRLCVGGRFGTAGGAPARSVASWDGSVWRSLGAGGGGVGYSGGSGPASVNALIVLGSNLIAGGDFDHAMGVASTAALAQWDGGAWSALANFGAGPGRSADTVYCLGVTTEFAAGQGHNLYVGGDFDATASVPAANIARYNTASGVWSSVAGGLPGTMSAMMVLQLGGLHSVTVSCYATSAQPGGTFRYTTVSNTWNQVAPETATCYGITQDGLLAGGVRGLSVRDGNNWMPLGDGLNGSISRMLSLGDDLVAVGNFTVADRQLVNGVARFDGQRWHPLGPGPGLTSQVGAVIFNGDVVVAGTAQVGANFQSRVMAWDGSIWRQMGSLSGTYASTPAVLNGSLYVAANGVVHRWNGLSWTPIGNGPGSANFSVNDILLKDGVLYASSGFSMYRFGGTQWTPITNSYPGEKELWIVWDNSLVGAAGAYGGGGIHRFLDPGWETLLPTTFNAYVSAMATRDNDLLALVTDTLGRYNGTDWDVLGHMTGSPRSILVRGGEIIVSGSVATVDGVVSPVWARLSSRGEADFNRSGAVSVQDIFDFLTAYFAAEPCADFNGSGTVTVQDIFDFLTAYFAA